MKGRTVQDRGGTLKQRYSAYLRTDEAARRPITIQKQLQLYRLENLQQLHLMSLDDSKIFDVLDLEKEQDQDVLNPPRWTQTPQEAGQFMDVRSGIKARIEDLMGTTQSQETEIPSENNEEESQGRNYLFLERFQARTIGCVQSNKIQYSNEKKYQRELAHHGYNYQTQNLGLNFKKATSFYLTLLMETRSLDEQEELAAQDFFQTNGAFQDFNRLFEVEGLRLKCREYYQSSTFVRSFVGSAKMDLRSKLTMLRHAEQLRSLTFKQRKNWKIPTL